MSKKKKPSFNFLHYVDDENNIVYVESRGWAGTLAATTQVKKYYPDHKINIVKQEFIEDLNADD